MFQQVAPAHPATSRLQLPARRAEATEFVLESKLLSDRRLEELRPADLQGRRRDPPAQQRRADSTRRLTQKDLAYDCDDLRREVQKLKFVGLNNGPATHPRPEAKKADRLSLALLLACCFLAFLVGKNLL